MALFLRHQDDIRAFVGSVVRDWTAVGPLPASWTSQVIGSASPSGAASGDGGSFTISGSGSDIWGAADAFRYAWQPISGDFDAVVRVDSQVNTNAWAKAGLMVRESTAVGSPHVSVFVTPGNGTVMQHRAIAGGSSSSIAGPLTPAPTWVKLSRRGTVFTSYQSSDGVTWKLIATRTVALPGSALVGLAVTSHANGVLSTASFSGFTLAPVAPN